MAAKQMENGVRKMGSAGKWGQNKLKRRLVSQLPTGSQEITKTKKYFPIMRLIYLVLAYFFLALGIIGIFVPGLPTVPFLLLTAWCASRGSVRLHRWLYAHPQIGQLLIDWKTKRAISRSSKIVAVSMLLVSWFVMFHLVSTTWLVWLTGVFFVLVALFLATRNEPD